MADWSYKGQPWQQHGQYYSDVPVSNGKLSALLKHELASYDLLDLKVLLRSRGIRTVRILRSLAETERSVMLHKALMLYFDVLGGPCPEGVKTALYEFFGETCPIPARPPQQDTTYPRATQSRGRATQSHGRATHSHGHNVWGPLPTVPEHLLDVPCGDDTKLKRELITYLPLALNAVGPMQYAECIRKVRRSDELIMAGCVAAAEALAALCIRKEDVPFAERENLKSSKKSLRNLILWRCSGISIGMDSIDALLRIVNEACRHSGCDQNTMAELKNGFSKVCAEIAMEVQTKKEKAINSTEAAQAAQAAKAAKKPKTVPALIDRNAPSSSDAVFPHPDDPADLHNQEPIFVRLPTERRSLPPTRRSPGRSRDSENSVQMSQLFDMMKVLKEQIGQEMQLLKGQIGQLQQGRRFHHDDDESD